MRLSWLASRVLERARETLRQGLGSWDELFVDDQPRAGAPPADVGVPAEAWPRMATHVARAERVREVVARHGLAEAARRFGSSPHAIERAVLLEESGAPDLPAVVGVLDCAIDEYLLYGELLSRLVELSAADPEASAAAFERFVERASAMATDELSWPERVRVARDGLAAMYVKIGRADDAEALFSARLAEERDATVAISAARAFLEAGQTARAVDWLERGAARAREVGREGLERTLAGKAATLRARLK